MTISRDIEYIQHIGQKIFAFAPNDAVEIIFNAKINVDGDSAKFKYNYKDNFGESGWFLARNGVVEEEIFYLLKEHRNFFISQGQQKWLECTLKIDVIGRKFHIDFKYD